jgi:exopolyphosphatase / guanosine-5'-triphosphate,3'-diphosphate pyrophosphatase
MKDAQGRLKLGEAVAIIDIGSNSVRLVAYEGLTRAPTPIFNEKALCALGRGVGTTGLLADEAMDKTLKALKRYRILTDIMNIKDVTVIATAAARDAENGAPFLQECEAITGQPVQLISGKREAELSALGVISGMQDPNGLVGDLGGGSLELIDVLGTGISDGLTLPLGALVLQDIAGTNRKKSHKYVQDMLAQAKILKKLKGRKFYAVGGTWRALARLHMKQRGYPLNVIHNYIIPAQDVTDLLALVERVQSDTLGSIKSVSEARRPLLQYGALVLEEIIKRGRPSDVVISALGVREGLLFERLKPETRKLDPLMTTARELNVLRSRAPEHGEELCDWTDALWASSGLDETSDEKRLRHAACLLSDIGWRAHPDYRGEQAFNIIANAAFTGIDHPGRSFISLAVAYRHMGSGDEDVSPRLRELVSTRFLDRARILGAAFRVAYLVSAAMPGVLPKAKIRCDNGTVLLSLPNGFAGLANERLLNRLRTLARILGRSADFSLS